MVVKWLKTAFLAALLIGAGYFFGMVCWQMGQAYEVMLFPSIKLVELLLWFLLALGAVLISAGLAAALLRPVWLGIIAFVLSGLAMLPAWQVTLGSGILAFAYVFVASIYAVRVAREMNQRLRFSVGSIGEGQGILLMALTLVACGSLYIGYAAYIEREGFSIPGSFIEMTDTIMDLTEEQVMARVPAEQRAEAAGMVAEMREELPRAVDEFVESTVKPHEQLIPVVVAVSVFMSLVTITRLLAWVPTVILRAVFPLLRALRVTRVVTETQEVQRLTIG